MKKHFIKAVGLAATLSLFVLMRSKSVDAADNFGYNAETAGMIAFGTEYSGSLSTEGDYKTHWYTFTTKASDDYYYAMSLDKLKMKGSFILELLDSDGKRVESISIGDSKKQLRLKPGTSYYLRGYCPSGIDADNMYAFTLDTIDDPETDSMVDVKLELLHNKAYDGTIATTYEEDWFVFYAKSGEATIQVSKKDVEWGLGVKIFDKDGKQLKSTMVGRSFSDSLTMDTEKGEMYYVCVSTNSSFDYGEEKDNSYSITLLSGSDEAEQLLAPTSVLSKTKVVVGMATPNATVKCIYGKKEYTVRADATGVYTIKLKKRLKKNAKVVLWQVVDGTASERLVVKVTR